MHKLKIYVAHPINGLSYNEVVSYYKDIGKKLRQMGYEVYHPMVGKSFLRTEKKFRSDYSHPIATNHAVKERDKWMVKHVDVLLVDFTNARGVSIGCVSELAWADDTPTIHTVVVLPKGNIHDHAFVKEMADVLFESREEALDYLRKLIEMEV